MRRSSRPLFPRAILLAALLLFPAASRALAPPERDAALAEVEAKVGKGLYRSAAAAIREEPERFADPELFSRYVLLLVADYARQEGFRSFALVDLSPGESLDQLRARGSATDFLETDFEAELHRRIDQNPDDPHLNFAVGIYLSRADECRCFIPKLFTGEVGEDYAYFKKAREGGVESAWSLFRMGAYLQTMTEGREAEAEALYRKAIELDSKVNAAHFNLAVLRLVAGDLVEGRIEAEKALDGYNSAELNAGTHHLMARIEEVEGNADAAEVQYRRALEITPWHAPAFADFLRFCRQTGRDAAYRETALAFIGFDFTNPFGFNSYIEFLAGEGVTPLDREIFRALVNRTYDSPLAEATIWFNLGRAADLQGDPMAAVKRYRHAKELFLTLPAPPAEAVESLDNLIQKAMEKIPAGPFHLPAR